MILKDFREWMLPSRRSIQEYVYLFLIYSTKEKSSFIFPFLLFNERIFFFPTLCLTGGGRSPRKVERDCRQWLASLGFPPLNAVDKLPPLQVESVDGIWRALSFFGNFLREHTYVIIPHSCYFLFKLIFLSPFFISPRISFFAYFRVLICFFVLLFSPFQVSYFFLPWVKHGAGIKFFFCFAEATFP